MDYLQQLMKRYPQLEPIRADINAAFVAMAESFAGDGKLLIAGNGGSAFREMLRVLKTGGILITAYDFADSKADNVTNEAYCVEIFTPDLIQDTLSSLGIKTTVNHTQKDIQKSLEDMCRDKVNISAGITVGGFMLGKEILE
jgi:hypothetical protein